VKAPEITYRYIYPKDIAGPTFEIMTRADTLSASSTSLNDDVLGIPKDRTLVLTNVAVHADPGATFSVLDIQIVGFTGAGLVFSIALVEFVAVADQQQTLNWQGEVYLQGRGIDQAILRLHSTYSSGAAANLQSFGLHGIVIPRGNAAAF